MCLVTVRNGNNIVAEGSIVQNQNAKDFTSKLDAQSYLSGYDIFISTLVGKDNKVEITNYPKVGVIYKLKENLEIFKITDTGLVHIVPYLNEIISRNNNNEELARIKLNPDTKRLEVTSTGKIAPSPAIPNNPNNYLNAIIVQNSLNNFTVR